MGIKKDDLIAQMNIDCCKDIIGNNINTMGMIIYKGEQVSKISADKVQNDESRLNESNQSRFNSFLANYEHSKLE